MSAGPESVHQADDPLPLEQQRRSSTEAPTDAEYRLMIDSVSDYAIFLLDCDGFVRSWNAGARLLKLYEADEIIGRHFSIFYPAELLARRWPEQALRTAGKIGRFEDEGWRLRKDGSRFWASIVLTKLVDAQGQHLGYSKITRDLTDRRRQEDRLRQSDERFRLLVEGVSDYAIFMLNTRGTIISWNSGAQKNKGYTADEIIGQHFSIFYPPDVVASGWPEDELRFAIRDGRFEDEGWRVRKDGSRFWASVVITALYDDLGHHRGFAKITRDLTDRRRIVALEDESRRITAFIAMLGHELRNPLAPMANALSILQLPQAGPEAVRIAREVIDRQLRQMTRLVDDLLDVGRITSGKVHLEWEQVKLRDAVMEALETAEPHIQAKRHVVELHIDDADLWMRGDRARLIQIVGNLLNNAAKFTPAGGRIQLSLQQRGSNARIVVQDNGPGIAAATLPHVFGLFVQGEQDASRSLGGLGLGLSLVQQLVTMHGGDVEVHSAPDQSPGARFTVTLPLTHKPKPVTLPAAAASRGHKFVIVVDDNVDAALTLQLLLQGMGYETGATYDGHAAVDIARSRRPEVMIIDIGLPGLTGLEVATQIRRDMQHPPIMIALSGYGQDKDRDASLAAGFIAHFAKPLDVAQLTTLLATLD